MDINKFKKKIGLNIKLARVKKGFKQSELADFAQLTRGSIGKMERGQQNFTIETLFAIANVLDIEPETLLCTK